MSDTAFQTQYRQEFIKGFEQTQSILRDCVTTEAVFKGNEATFLVADSGGAEATTRGTNGKIPSRADNLAQPVCALAEWHDKPIKTGYNIFASQGNQRQIMQATSMSVVNRKVDSTIIDELANGTITIGASAVASLARVMNAKVKLSNAGVPFDGKISAVVSPAFMAYLTQLTEFSSADFVGKQPLDTGETAWKDEQGYYRWLGVKWIEHPNLVGIGTSDEQCYMFHESAIGHASDTERLTTNVGYDKEDDYSFARTTCYMGAKLLQNTGVILMRHDGSALA